MELLKIDKKHPYHYIIGVGMKDLISNNPGQIYLKYGPVYYTNTDILNVYDAIQLRKDKIYREIYKMTPSDIYRMKNCSDILATISALKLASIANNCTLHHFSCELQIPDAEKFFVGLVERANKFEDERKKLHDSRI